MRFGEHGILYKPQKYYFFLKIVKPSIAVITTNAMKTKNIILAIEAAPAAIPVKPNSAATIAITKKTAVHFSIIFCFYYYLSVFKSVPVSSLSAF
jgi:hypothetical protein